MDVDEAAVEGVEEAPASGSFRIVLRSEVDLVREPELRKIVADYRASSSADVLVDLSEVTFIDSTGLNFLVLVHKAASERGGAVTLVGASPGCVRLLRLTGLDKVFEVRQA